MPREHRSRREILEAIKSLPSMADLTATHEGHYDYELDLEVTVYGRNYHGKKVGPYVRLLTYEPGETVIAEGDWGGNTFYIVVQGQPEVFLKTSDRGEIKVSEVPPGRHFGEMSVLAGVPRSATVKAPADKTAQVLEVQRPALRLLRKPSKFGESLDQTYLHHGRKSTFQELHISSTLSQEMIDQPGSLSQFRVFSKNHALFREHAPIDYLYVIKEGWGRRSQERSIGSELKVIQDFLGSGYCFGLEGVMEKAVWPYTVTLMGRSEVLLISIAELRQHPALRDQLLQELARFAPPATIGENLPAEPVIRGRLLTAQEKLINTGLADGTNLLVMDMDLCVRCGRCSLACHQIHGQSRLLRRGIHVTRLESPKKNAVQEILSPAVCMHCQDPECLTGCPTGAIGRFSLGQIDIDPKTCIGCGDCATNCPYSAISMVPRQTPAATTTGRLSKLRDLLRLKAPPLPPAIEQTDDLLAVKCNLCSGTSLNPPGNKAPAYGCEENCPTGSLVRINPREYFTEIKQIEGIAFLDQTHAVGRNIHRSDPLRRAVHVVGILLALLLTASAVAGLERYGLGAPLLGPLNMRWLTGLTGLVSIIGVMTYPIRRQIFRRRAGPLRYWMLAHSYLGVMAAVMILLHGGTNPGGALTSALMITFDLVILTGLFGIFCYLAVPRWLTKMEGDPLLLDDLKERRAELQQEIREILRSQSVRQVVADRVVPRFVSLGYLLRQYLRPEKLDAMLAAARAEFQAEAARLADESERRQLIRAIEAVATLRRVEALIFLHYLLKAWLPPHVVVTSLMLALLLAHLIQVFYAWR